MSTHYTVTITGDGAKQRTYVRVGDWIPGDARPESVELAAASTLREVRDAAIRKVYGSKAEWAPVTAWAEQGLVFWPVSRRYGGGVEALTGEIRVAVRKT